MFHCIIVKTKLFFHLLETRIHISRTDFVEMDCCNGAGCGGGGNYGGGSYGGDMDEMSLKDVMEVLRSASRDEIISQLEGIGFSFGEKELANQLSRLDRGAQLRVFNDAGVK